MRRGLAGTPILPAAKINAPKLIVGDNTAVKALAAMYDKTPLETLKQWQRFKVADQASDYLSKRFVDSKFEFTQDADRRQGAAPALAPWHRARSTAGSARCSARLMSSATSRRSPRRRWSSWSPI